MGEACPEICPRLHRTSPHATRIDGQSRHGSVVTGLPGTILSPDTRGAGAVFVHQWCASRIRT